MPLSVGFREVGRQVAQGDVAGMDALGAQVEDIRGSAVGAGDPQLGGAPAQGVDIVEQLRHPIAMPSNRFLDIGQVVAGEVHSLLQCARPPISLRRERARHTPRPREAARGPAKA